jgi:hypothetical protein
VKMVLRQIYLYHRAKYFQDNRLIFSKS